MIFDISIQKRIINERYLYELIWLDGEILTG